MDEGGTITVTTPKGERLTIERLYGSPDLNGPTARTVRFSPDGSRISFLRPKEDDRTVQDLWTIDVETGEASVLVDARALAPEERELTEAEIQALASYLGELR